MLLDESLLNTPPCYFQYRYFREHLQKLASVPWSATGAGVGMVRIAKSDARAFCARKPLITHHLRSWGGFPFAAIGIEKKKDTGCCQLIKLAFFQRRPGMPFSTQPDALSLSKEKVSNVHKNWKMRQANLH